MNIPTIRIRSIVPTIMVIIGLLILWLLPVSMVNSDVDIADLGGHIDEEVIVEGIVVHVETGSYNHITIWDSNRTAIVHFREGDPCSLGDLVRVRGVVAGDGQEIWASASPRLLLRSHDDHYNVTGYVVAVDGQRFTIDVNGTSIEIYSHGRLPPLEIHEVVLVAGPIHNDVLQLMSPEHLMINGSIERMMDAPWDWTGTWVEVTGRVMSEPREFNGKFYYSMGSDLSAASWSLDIVSAQECHFGDLVKVTGLMVHMEDRFRFRLEGRTDVIDEHGVPVVDMDLLANNQYRYVGAKIEVIGSIDMANRSIVSGNNSLEFRGIGPYAGPTVSGLLLYDDHGFRYYLSPPPLEDELSL